MRHTDMEMQTKPKTRKWALILGLLTALALFGGCATGGKVKPDAKESEPAAGQGPTVAPLPEGRQGFVIREVPQLGETARRDFDRAVDLLQAQDYEGAVELLESVIEASPGVTAPYINVAIAYRHLEQPEKAEGHLKKALELVPDHPVACNEFGLLYRKSGRFDEARAMYEQALARFPDYLPAHRNLAILCDLYLNDLECALEHYEVYSRARPGDEQVQLWIADLRMRLGIH